MNEISSRGTLLVVALFDALPSFLNDFLTGSSGVHFLDPFDCLLQTCPSFCKLRIGLQSGVKCEWFITERRCSSIMAIHPFQLRWWHYVSRLVGGIVSQSTDYFPSKRYSTFYLKSVAGGKKKKATTAMKEDFSSVPITSVSTPSICA